MPQFLVTVEKCHLFGGDTVSVLTEESDGLKEALAQHVRDGC